MKDLHSEKKIDVVIDSENAQYSVLTVVLSELAKHWRIIDVQPMAIGVVPNF